MLKSATKTGLLVAPYGSVKALVKVIVRVLADDWLREKLSINAVEWTKQFSWERMAKETLQIVEIALEEF